MPEQNILAERNGKTIYRDGDKLVKLFDGRYSKSSILNEALNQTRVAETGLNIPRVYEVAVIDGNSAIVMDYIEGETLEQLLRKYPEKRGEMLSLFLQVQREIHSKKQLLLTKFADKLKMKIMQSELAASTRYELSMRLDAMPKHTHICHGDYDPSNVIIDKSGTPYVIDWSHASQGNATADAVKTYLLFCTSGNANFAEIYMEEYCNEAGIEKSYFCAWKPLIAAARLISSNGSDERSFLMSWIKEDGSA